MLALLLDENHRIAVGFGIAAILILAALVWLIIENEERP